MVWNRLKSWLTPAPEAENQASTLDELLNEWGFPKERKLDDHSKALLASELDPTLKQLAARRWLIRFDTSKGFDTQGPHSRVASIMLARAGVSKVKLTEYWHEERLTRMRGRHNGRVIDVRYHKRKRFGPRTAVADTQLLELTCERIAQQAHSPLAIVALQGSQELGMMCCLPRRKLQELRRRHLLGQQLLVPNHRMCFTSYDEGPMSSGGLRAHDGAFELISTDQVKLFRDIAVVNGELCVDGVDTLGDLSGLKTLTAIGALAIGDCDRLENLVGLHNLALLGGYLSVRNNSQLLNLGGLNSLTCVYGPLRIERNNALVDLTGLERLSAVEGKLVISNYAQLRSIQQLKPLEFIGDDLRIVGNPQLESLDGLENIPYIGGDLEIRDNAKLPTSAAVELHERLVKGGFRGVATIQDNLG